MRHALAPLLFAATALADASPPAPALAHRQGPAEITAAPPGVCPLIDALEALDATGRPTGHRLAARTVALAAVDNQNRSYRLSALGPGDGREPNARLCLDGRAITAGSWGTGNAAGLADVGFSLDRATADRAAAALGLERHDRHPLDGDLRWRFVAPAQVRAGAHVPLRWTVENRGRAAIDFFVGGAYRGSNRDNRFACTAARDGVALPDAGNANNFGGLGGYRKLAPGASDHVDESLERWVTFDRPGRYRVRCSYHTELTRAPQDREWGRSDRSWDLAADGELAIDVTP